MLRRFCVPVLIAGLMVWAAADALACGDKFLRVGRSPRFRAYASVHPSAILVYAPRWTPRGIAEFEQMLKRAGHKPMTVTTAGAMTRAFGAGRYDVVITGYADSLTVRKEIDVLPSRPALMPVLYKPAKAVAAEASAAYACVLRPDRMSPFEALEEIDRLIELQLKGAAKPSAR
ncbi:MAG TPA: hypothetical protein VFK57_13160 [Vicinamibacterales bacterium]|nr:hypothetical protein [Vicinamibacterales bacterium]